MRIHPIIGLTAFSLLFLSNISQAQLNMVLQDSMDYNVGVNDVCGWAAPDGKEYALVGVNTGVSIVDINSDTIHEVVFVPGADNLWRDINTFGNYAYVSSEAKVGLLIIDLQFLPDSVQTFIWKDTIPTPGGNFPFEKAHTLWVDEFGICYLNGSNLNGGGVVMIDVASNPTDPVFLGLAPAIYSHDCYSRNKIIYSAEISTGNASIYDAHDPQNVTLLGRVRTPHEFTHNTWLSDNSQIMFTTDERSNSYVTSYDISDPGNIRELDRYRQAATEGLGNIVHNAYVWDDWVIVAYYANGTVIVDGSRPDNLVEVGNFDSFLGADGGFPGVWGSFPFLPSGKILASDRNNGLFVFIPNYVRACFFEGFVVDSVTGLPLDNATVKIETSEIILPQTTQIDGAFKTGKAIPGQYNITVTRDGYFDKTFQRNFINGNVIQELVKLTPLQLYSISGNVINIDNEDVPFAKVSLSGSEGIYNTTCDANGNFLLPAVYEGSYELQAGIWGQTYETLIQMDEPKSITVQIYPGYYDDFDLDLGWTISGQVSSGAWERGIPSGQLLYDQWECGSETDSPNDNGGNVYSTGLSSTQNVLNDEVNGGITWLVSPPMDLTELIDPSITFDYWVCEFPPNQFGGLIVWITNGVDTILIEELSNEEIIGSWESKSYVQLGIPGPLDQVRFMVSAMDTTLIPNEYTLKAHFDKFRLAEAGLSTNDPESSGKYFVVYPNPVRNETIHLKPQEGMVREITSILIYDIQGRSISTHAILPGAPEIDLDLNLEDGIYFLQWSTARGEMGVEKILVLKN